MERQIKIVAIDPGVNMGMSALAFNRETQMMEVIDALTVNVDDYIKHYLSELEFYLGTEIARAKAVEKIIYNFCNAHCPDYLAHETAFSSHGRSRFGNAVQSFGRLSENILAIKLASFYFDSSMPIIEVNPTTVKFTVVGVKNNNKDDVSSALKELDDIILTDECDSLDQHGWDSIAIGYTFAKKKLGRRHEHSKHGNSSKGYKDKRTR